MNENKVAEAIIQLQSNVSDIREKMATKEDISSLYVKEDKLIKLLETVTTELASTNNALNRHEKSIEGVEKDVKKLKTDVKEIQKKLQQPA